MRSIRLVLLLLLCAPALAAQDSAQSSPALVITHVTVVDVKNGVLLANHTVVVQYGRIKSVTRSEHARIPKGAQVVEGRGKYLIPGMWDMHYHFEGKPNAREFNLLIANGVVGIRDMGDIPEEIFRARNEIAAGRRLGPHIVACGPIVDGPNPSNPPLSVAVHDAGEARRTVRDLKAQGADCVKVHDGLPLDTYLAIADEAKAAGLPLVGHVPPSVKTLQATNAGQRSIEHQIGFRGMSTAEEEVMTIERTSDVFAEAMRTKNFRLIPESIATKGDTILDRFSPQLADALFRAFAHNGTYLVPTLVTDRSLTLVDTISKEEDPRQKYIPASQREWWDPERGMLTRYRTPHYIAFRKRQFAKTLELIPLAHRAGVQFLAGTDTTLPFVYPGFSLHDELELFVRAGLTPLQALQTATLNPAGFLGLEPSQGTVEAGKLADLVLLEADPLVEIQNTKKVFAVVLGGRFLSRGALDQLLKEAEMAAATPVRRSGSVQ